MIPEYNRSDQWRGQPVRILAVGDPGVEIYRSDGELTRRWSEATEAPVEVVVLEWAAYASSVFAALEQRTGEYDAVMLPGFFWLPKFASSGWLLPLDGLLAELPALQQAYAFEDILPGLREEFFFGGQHYLLPSFAEIQVVCYRRDWAAEAGFSDLSGPLSIRDFTRLAAALHRPPERFGTQLKGSLAESLPEWLPFLSEFGGRLFDAHEAPTFDSQAGRLSLQAMADLLPYCGPGVENSDNAVIAGLVREGRVGLINHWSGQFGPLFAAGNPATLANTGFTYFANPWGTVWSFGLSAGSRNPLGALAYLLYATGPQADRLQGRASGSPVRRSTYLEAQEQAKYPWYPATLAALERKNSFPSFPGFADAAGPLYQLVHTVLSGAAQADAAITQTAEQLRARS